MIDASFSTSRARVGSKVEMRLNGDGPFIVAISCFVFEPPPPGYRGCPQCETKLRLDENETAAVVVETEAWSGVRRGELRFTVYDSRDESAEYVVAVVSDSEETGMTRSAFE